MKVYGEKLLKGQAKTLYNEAKFAAMEGDFEKAEGKHLGCAIVYEKLGENALSVRAKMRAIWYKIQNQNFHEAEDVIKEAIKLSPLQTAGGLHQAIEFSLFEGNEEAFNVCELYLEKIAANIGIKIHPKFKDLDPSSWIYEYSNIAQSIYSKLIDNAASEMQETWVRSDTARLYYFRSLISSVYDRIQLLRRASELFLKHKIPYRSHLCKGESFLWEACVADDEVLKNKKLLESEAIFINMRLNSLGFLAYRKMLQTSIDILKLASPQNKTYDVIERELKQLQKVNWSEAEDFYRRLLLDCIIGATTQNDYDKVERFKAIRQQYFISKALPLSDYFTRVYTNQKKEYRNGKAMEKMKILFLAANPINSTQLQLDKEAREIENKIRTAEYRENFEFITKWAVQPDDLLQSLNEIKPTIVHFSGHGNIDEEIILSDNDSKAKPVGVIALKSLFTTLKDNIRVVLLNACFSELQAKTIVESIDCAIGMNNAIGDKSAILFAASFYRALAFGRTIQESFDQGITAILLEGLEENNTPVLMVRDGVNPKEIRFVEDS